MLYKCYQIQIWSAYNHNKLGNTWGSAVAHSSFFCSRAYRQVNPALTKAKKSAFQHLQSRLVYTLHLFRDWVVGSSLTWSEPSAGGNIRKILTGFRSDEGEITHTVVVAEVTPHTRATGRRKLGAWSSADYSVGLNFGNPFHGFLLGLTYDTLAPGLPFCCQSNL